MLFCFVSSDARAAQKVVALEQRSDGFGYSKAYLSKTAIKVLFSPDHVFLVAKAPDWTIMLCNAKQRRALTMPYSRWLDHDIQLNYLTADWNRYRLQSVPTKKIKEICGKFANSANIYSQNCPPERRYLQKVVLEMWTLKYSDCAYQSKAILQKIVNCPQAADLPLELNALKPFQKIKAYYKNVGGISHYLVTTAIATENVADDFFSYPSKMGVAESEIQILNDAERTNRANDALRDFLD